MVLFLLAIALKCLTFSNLFLSQAVNWLVLLIKRDFTAHFPCCSYPKHTISIQHQQTLSATAIILLRDATLKSLYCNSIHFIHILFNKYFHIQFCGFQFHYLVQIFFCITSLLAYSFSRFQLFYLKLFVLLYALNLIILNY